MNDDCIELAASNPLKGDPRCRWRATPASRERHTLAGRAQNRARRIPSNRAQFSLNRAEPRRFTNGRSSAVQNLLASRAGEASMSLVRLLGFRTLACGCVIGRYREVATSRELTYVEEKGAGCEQGGHRRNHTVA